MNGRNNIILDPNLVLNLPLHKLDGSSIMSRDACGHLCPVTGASWRPDGRYFDGVDDYVDLNDSFEAVGGSTSKTLIAWAKPGKTDFSTLGRVVSIQRSSVYTAFSIHAGGNPATWKAFYITGSTDFDVLNSNISLVVGQPVFLAVIQDGNTIRFHVDSTVVTASNGGTPTMDTPANTHIGAYNNTGTPSQFFAGVIGEVCIFARALTFLEIERIRLATK